jgi:hypothetical protein
LHRSPSSGIRGIEVIRPRPVRKTITPGIFELSVSGFPDWWKTLTFRRIGSWAATATLLIHLLCLAAAAAAAHHAPVNRSHSAAYQSAERKARFLQENARRPRPEPATTTLTMDELNAYVAEGGVDLPTGVERVRFRSVPAVVTAAARIDFDKLTASRRSSNPLMAMLFTGVHDVVIAAQATGSRGIGSVRVEFMSIDDVRVPRAAMQFLIDHYLKPRYGPNLGLDSTFRLPARIDTAVVGSNQVTVTQR